MLAHMPEQTVDVMLCERCGAPLPEEARFCPRCGAPVAVAATHERKVVTVLFADLAHSTELAARLDAERFREVMADFFRMVSAELESLRGRAEKFVGDAVMAMFGLPQTHEDDALRAVRAGLIIRDRTARMGESLGLPIPLQVRVGINTGSVATGSGIGDQFLVSGAAVNLAVRLQEAADPGQILVGETTHQLTRHAVAFGPLRTIAARGFDQKVTAWPVESLSSKSVRRTIPMVDRRRELALLMDTFQRIQETKRAHLVTILGEAGVGKSRLVEEFAAGLSEEVKVLTGRAGEFEEDPTFAPIAEMIRRELGVEPGEPADKLRARLRKVVEGCCEPSESEQVAARLGLALGLGEEAREAQRYRAAEIRAGFLTFLARTSMGKPIVLVFDDLQLGMPALLELIEQTIRQARKMPLLAISVARDRLLQDHPGWGGGLSDSVTIRLEPLGEEDARELAASAGESLDEATARQIASQAGGNPFFIIETTGMLLQEHPEHIEGILHGHVLPPTVQAVVASRIDHLPEEARDLVRKASVFAQATFSESELAYIAEPNKELLQILEDAELLLPDPKRSGVWRFRHDMLRDVAYETMPKRERLRLHLRVADELERADPARHPQGIAYHLEQAAKASLDLDPADRGLADRAVQALARAGDLARWRMEPRTAGDLYDRALALAGAEEKWDVREARILAAWGETLSWLGEFDRATAVLTRALELGGDDGWTVALAGRFLADIELNVRSDLDRADSLFDRALEAARALDESDKPWVLARVLLMAGWVPYWRKDLSTARAMWEEALEVARKNPDVDLWAEARALTSLTSAISPVGDEAECLEMGRQALALGRKMGDPFTIAVAQENVGNSLRRMWELDEALSSLEESVRIFRDIGARWELASAIGDRSMIHRYAGRLEEAEADIREALDICRQLRERNLTTWTAAELALVLVLRGERTAARRALQEALDNPTGEPGSRVAPLEVDVLLALGEGDRDRAEARAREVLENDRPEGWRNVVAARNWWAGRLFGPEFVGGDRVVDESRRTLESANWIAALREPDLFVAAVGALS